MDLALAIRTLRSRIGDRDTLTYPDDWTEEEKNDFDKRSSFQLDKLKFTDNDLIYELTTAVQTVDKDLTIETMPDNKFFLAYTLAMASCYRNLAAREAKAYRISVDGITIAKSERVTNYLKIAESLDKQYQATILDPNWADIEVDEFTRYNVRRNKMVGEE